MTTTHRHPMARVYGGLLLGVAAVSFAAIFIRLAEAPPLAIAAYRLCIASLVVVPASLVHRRDRYRVFTPAVFLWAAVAGVFLALHFGFWIASLDYTSVASSVVLVTTSPILIAVVSHFFLGDRVSLGVAVGIGVALMGGLILGIGDWQTGGRELQGDLLALLGALSVVGYLLIGRWLRGRLPLLPYIATVYGVAALLLLSSALIAHQPLSGYSAATYGWLVLVALVPQVLGHSLLNWTLAHVSATLVSVSVMAEPVVATLLAIGILREMPPITSVVGGAFILVGVYLALRRGRLGPGPVPLA